MYIDLKNLVSHWNNIAKEDWAIEDDMSSMYIQDANDAQNVLDFLEHSNIEGAMSAINRMDTAPRESVVMAIYADTDKKFVHDLGWEIA